MRNWRGAVYNGGAGGASQKRARPRRKVQKEILERQQHRCAYCGGRFGMDIRSRIEWDHVKPFSVFGNMTEFVAACGRCNRIKSSMWFDSFEEAARYVRKVLEHSQLAASSDS